MKVKFLLLKTPCTLEAGLRRSESLLGDGSGVGGEGLGGGEWDEEMSVGRRGGIMTGLLKRLKIIWKKKE